MNLDRLLKPSKAKMIRAISRETEEDCLTLQQAGAEGKVLPLDYLSQLADREVERTKFLVSLGALPASVWASAVERAQELREFLRARHIANGGKIL
jgi:hypothetical protein